MAIFERKIRFLREDGSFDHTKFLNLLNKARNELHNKKGKDSKTAKALSKPILIGGVGDKEIWAVINKLASFLSSGIDLKTAFSIVSTQIPNAKLAKMISDVRENLDHGLSVSDTLKMHSKYFDPLIIALIEVGEKTGTLPRVMADLERTLLENLEIRAKIKGALVYPVILIVLAFSMAIFMLTFVLPKITAVFSKNDVEIPALTQFMINLSNFLMGYWILLSIGLFAFIVGFSVFSRTYA